MRTYEEDVVDTKGLYDFVLAPEGDEMYIKILKGDWKDVIYRYGKVGFNPDEDESDDENDRLTLAFEYDIIALPSHLDEVDIPDEEYYAFENMLGDILVDIMQKDLETKAKDEARTADTKASIH